MSKIMLRSTLFVFFAIGLCGGNTVRSQDSLDLNEAERMMSFNIVELNDQLTNGLRVFLPEQQAFLNQVVAKVDSGELPRAMVNVVFVWSRKRHPRVPFPYFEYALRVLAEKRGVTFN